jgi:acyl carrier protein
MENRQIRERVVNVLANLTEIEYKEIFEGARSDDERLQMLTSESMLALLFVTSLEDEFGIEFRDDEIDLNFFSTLDALCTRIENLLQKAMLPHQMK